jgi:hypothetical protein
MGEAFCFGFDVGSEDLVIKFVLLLFDEVLLIEFLMDRPRGGKVAMMSWFPGLREFAWVLTDFRMKESLPSAQVESFLEDLHRLILRLSHVSLRSFILLLIQSLPYVFVLIVLISLPSKHSRVVREGWLERTVPNELLLFKLLKLHFSDLCVLVQVIIELLAAVTSPHVLGDLLCDWVQGRLKRALLFFLLLLIKVVCHGLALLQLLSRTAQPRPIPTFAFL